MRTTSHTRVVAVVQRRVSVQEVYASVKNDFVLIPKTRRAAPPTFPLLALCHFARSLERCSSTYSKPKGGGMQPIVKRRVCVGEGHASVRGIFWDTLGGCRGQQNPLLAPCHFARSFERCSSTCSQKDGLGVYPFFTVGACCSARVKPLCRAADLPRVDPLSLNPQFGALHTHTHTQTHTHTHTYIYIYI